MDQMFMKKCSKTILERLAIFSSVLVAVPPYSVATVTGSNKGIEFHCFLCVLLGSDS